MKLMTGAWRQPSLFRRLFLGAMAGFALLLLAQGWIGYTRLIGGARDTVAEDLGQTAQAYAELFAVAGLAPEALAVQAQRLAAIKRSMTAPAMPAEEFRYSLWTRDGRLLASTAPEAPLRVPARLAALQDLQLDGQDWHVYAQVDRGGELIAVVAQAQAVYRRLAWSMLGGAAWMALAAALLVALWLGWSTYTGLAPLRHAAAQLRARTAHESGPLRLAPQHRELGPLVTAIDDLLQRMTTMRQAEHRFFADAAHELRTPLAAMGAQAHVLAHAGSPAERLAALAPLEQAVQRAGDLLAQLLMLSRLEAMAPAAIRLDLARLGRERLAQLASRAAQRNVDLAYEGAAQAWTQLDPSAAISLLDNLLGNALRHSPEGGSVTLVVAPTSQGVRVTVSDQGPGVPAPLRARVFERFYRAPDSPGDGSGLGLAIVRCVTELQGGRAWVQDAPDGGASFVVELP